MISRSRSLLAVKPGLSVTKALTTSRLMGSGLDDDGRFGHGGVLEQGRLDLERADQVAGRVDDVVVAAGEPEVAVGVELGPVAGDVPVVAELLLEGLFVVPVGPHARRPVELEGDQADLAVGRVGLVLDRVEDGPGDAGEGLAHRARPDLHPRVVADDDRAGLGLPVGVVEGLAEDLLGPDDGLGVERLADAGQVAEGRQVELLDDLVAGLHERADGRRRRVPHRHLALLDPLVPGLGREAGVEDALGDAQGERGDDAVGRARDPARVGRAPVDVVVAEVEGPLGRQVLGDEGVVDVLDALGHARRARGVVEDRGRLGLGRVDVEVLDRRGLLEREGDLAVLERRDAVVVDDDDVPEVRHLVEDLADLGGVLLLGDDGRRLGVGQADEERLVAEGREERLGDGADLEDAQEAEVELGDAVQEQADALARA